VQKNHANHANHAEHDESAPESASRRPGPTPGQTASVPLAEPATRYDHLAAELDDLAGVPTEVLADWVTARGRCLWENTFGDPPDWLTDADPDRELATRLCAGCPVRSECLEFELRAAGEDTVGVWGGLNVDDRLALLTVWRARRRDDVAALPNDEGWWRPADRDGGSR
jgi:WhiB family transcriptional regulator, redox-sensing transcriptional regulator